MKNESEEDEGVHSVDEEELSVLQQHTLLKAPRRPKPPTARRLPAKYMSYFEKNTRECNQMRTSKSMPESASSLFNSDEWRISTPDLLQQIGTLMWMQKGDDGKWLAEITTKARIGYEVYKRISKQDTIETYRTECYLEIAKFIQENPKANKKQVEEVVLREVEKFKQKVGTV
ncbi:DgyrCDS9804 [Dimorphilus gyrociliatus]|uniref:DgyrCDS9804 n=1 Tax=Dimorphilus gyrociliatus TaxID=2664684 RepID=A0A7I8VY27_9ANNE|nr:DgyrCDS9804 [Dimorphilus gyrociliatus]